MRLFIAINFDEQIKKHLADTQKRLREYTVKGNFTDQENLHLTLIFIGEVYGPAVDAVKKAMDAVTVPAFKLQLNGVGKFKRDRGDIWWMGISKSNGLNQVHSQLCGGLSLRGAGFDSRPYSPHLTLAREVTLDKSFDRALFSRKTPAINVPVQKISLMKLERLGEN